jgi:hypothetical protein
MDQLPTSLVGENAHCPAENPAGQGVLNTALNKTILSVAGNINHSSREKKWVFFG